ncbi:MAG: ABC transporter permease [Desulfobacterales bacterium]|jgi:tungstate transport system permease protein|nr:ABC transporter permease [Desulfobacter sp.]MDP6395043.1 ABC transporter permease [Desulfobacterales bacterium]MDP6683098.1 ABC transporter permease [Desulfobacterales bacterium]MDP6806481.1 ABC transporter permease [Desulfobacterales bacterium]|tara:strand:+ start:127215 stop:127910 length:696 start_codon:yes stop_codon:yes gene_type:complete
MNLLTDSLISALHLVVSLDADMVSIVFVSLKVSSTSTLVASLIGIPLGFFIAFKSFPGKPLVLTILNTLLALPTVVIGLFVYSFIARRGIFGSLGLLYTQKAIIIGQTLLVLPIVATFTIAAISRIDTRYRKTAMTLGANQIQTAVVLFWEARFGIIAAVIAAFGRVIAEVGISMMLGGNAKGFTRTITTAMALEFDKGEFTLAVALGIILLMVSFGINLLFHSLQGRSRI